ncbi:hypothetical protein G7009_02560 [Pseudomonas capeferrum]|uniref:hypothetical protein n=1 Tax=Pseudomonas capeferrum TaxID=1495066 RepID=UPI0015E3E702|nr:hypothetical protein [Pseudomonas capeferrum]MBA1200674.1 hypothetical protein [Pseudomonas capeferrum]
MRGGACLGEPQLCSFNPRGVLQHVAIHCPFGALRAGDGVPALGQHTSGILGKLGFSADEQARLVAAGVV